jgi:hypothetical protein
MLTLTAIIVTVTIMIVIEVNFDTAIEAVSATIAPSLTEMIVSHEVFVMASPWLRLPQWVGYLVTILEVVEKFSN